MSTDPAQADNSEDAPLTYDEIVALGKRLRRPASSLIVLAAKNDPFYLLPSRQAKARWFKNEVWDLLQPKQGVHLRRLHYALVSLAHRPVKPDGVQYENSEDDWTLLQEASVAAREMRLVDSGMFVDRRAGEPVHLHIPDDEPSDAEVLINATEPEVRAETAPSILYTPRFHTLPRWPDYSVDPPRIVEPYAIEIWAEKSTMDDVLAPIARQHDITYITGVGELSLTHCHRRVERVIEHQRATRILYVSDFDPGGDGMPVSISRKIEFLLRRDNLDLDIRLDPLVLTAAQVRRYRLPRIPIKDTDLRKDQFENRYGAGAVELDALEGNHPGELRRIVLQAIRPYREPARQQRREIDAVADQLQADADAVRERVLAEHADEIADLRTAFEAMQATIQPHRDALNRLVAEVEARLAEEAAEHVDAINAVTEPFYAQAAELFETINAELASEAPDASDVEWPEGYAADESDEQLFQSERSYLDQIARFKRHQGKPLGRKSRGRP